MQELNNLLCLNKEGYIIEEIKCQKYIDNTSGKYIDYDSIEQLIYNISKLKEEEYTTICITLSNNEEQILYIYNLDLKLIYKSVNQKRRGLAL